MRLIITGPPAAGKGSIAPFLAKEYGILPISTGQMFREEIKKQTPLGLKLKVILDRGELVSDNLTNQMVEARLKKEDVKNGFLLDGYPRSINQAEFLDKFLAERNEKLDYVISLYLEEEIIIKRIVGRRICPKCGKLYNIYFTKPKFDEVCDLDGTALIKRSDDTEQIARQRIKIYEKQTAPLIEYYKQKGILISSYSGHKKVEDTFDLIKKQVIADDHNKI
ncbi:MAG: adenylate kinase [Acholeplasmataceae bacterium]|jgi:adenylate kinase|nr:adenylate kinase [Acholeplasmataceae bacterium]